MKLSEMSNLNTFGAQLTDFWPYVAKIPKMRVWAFKIFLRFSYIIPCILIRNMLGNNMYYFDKVTFTRNVMREKVCVDISLFSVISYRACAIASEVIQIG